MEPPPPCPARKRKDKDAATAAAMASLPDTAAGGGGNRLLAGYLAHEFLASGTVLGERLVSAAGPAGAGQGEAARYEAVAALVMRGGAGGAYVPGVVNPAQLAAWARGR